MWRRSPRCRWDVFLDVNKIAVTDVDEIAIADMDEVTNYVAEITTDVGEVATM